MTEQEQQQLIDDHFLFDKPVSPLLLASGMARDWPDARGICVSDINACDIVVLYHDMAYVILWVSDINVCDIVVPYHDMACVISWVPDINVCDIVVPYHDMAYLISWHNDNKTFLVWVNEEDHLRVISMEKGGNMKEVFRRFCVGLKKIEEIFKKAGHPFMWTEHLGFVLTCPSNLGTGLRGGVHVRLPKLSQHPKFEEILHRLRLQKGGTGTGGGDPKFGGGTPRSYTA
ncbi:hypothetical protein ASZ78_015232 [Callipepla squamata]|uniref:Creatine kinase M-type n=1 Tax=Callipepla squamata TaxID=9009 RepID=A0A226MBT4_CALSU|nr:hypothetical protein ASZ78_015232 [Callipepla squamata]